MSLRAAMIVALALLLTLARGPALPADRPSFVVVLADDMGMAQIEAMSRLTGSVFGPAAGLRAYVEAPICGPSRATFLTGRFAHNHGVISNRTSGALIRPHEGSTFAVPMQQAGYLTAYYGKYINRYDGSYTPPGWTIWRPFQPCCVMKNQPVIIEGTRVYVPGVADDWMRDQAMDLIRATPPDTPLMIVLSSMAPHLPHRAPRRHEGRFSGRQVPRDLSFNERKINDKPAFLRPPLLTPAQVQALDVSWAASLDQLQTVDELVLGVYGALRDAGRLATTYLIFTSDNGIHFGQHRQPENKTQPWETDVRIPLLVRGPRVPSSFDGLGIVANADLAPTLLELAGLPGGERDGVSFAPMLRGEPSTRTAVPIAMWQESQPFALEWKGVRTKRYTYVKYPTGERMLFDNPRDPLQVQNLIDAPGNAGLIARLDALTERLFGCRGPTACGG
jgi:N-acetylglucosamine-6-sulfatase